MWKRLNGRNSRTLALAATLLVTACSDPTEGGSGSVQVLLKDFPVEAISSAEVWISRVYLVGGGEGHVDLFNDPDAPRHYDLLDLRAGLTADLTDPVPVAEGPYTELRLVVDSATIALAEGNAFLDGSTTATLFVPSGSQSGIKVDIEDDIEPEAGTTTIVLVDFDVEDSFVFLGSAQAGFHGVLFTPVLKEEDRSTEEN